MKTGRLIFTDKALYDDFIEKKSDSKIGRSEKWHEYPRFLKHYFGLKIDEKFKLLEGNEDNPIVNPQNSLTPEIVQALINSGVELDVLKDFI